MCRNSLHSHQQEYKGFYSQHPCLHLSRFLNPDHSAQGKVDSQRSTGFISLIARDGSFYYCSTLVYLEVRNGGSPSSIWDCFGYPYPLSFHMNFRIVYNFFLKWQWNFDGDCNDSVDCFWQDGHFITFILPVYEHGIFFNVFSVLVCILQVFHLFG